MLFGASLGFATGAGLAPRVHGKGGLALLWGATAAGTAMGRGAALLIADQPGRGDAAGTLVGSLAGTAGGVLALSAIEPDATDAGATIVGAGYGAMLGALTPSLGERAWSGWNRDTTGGLLLGAGAGAAGGVVLRRALHGDARAVGFTALGWCGRCRHGSWLGPAAGRWPRPRYLGHPAAAHRRRRRHDRRAGAGHGQLVSPEAGLGRSGC